jgi:thiamine biosynthesis protein ThiS
MKVRLNGREQDVPDGATVLQVLETARMVKPDVPVRRQGIAVEHNREVVPASQLGDVKVKSGDVLEVVTAFPGG